MAIEPELSQLCDLKMEDVDKTISAVSREDLDLQVINGDLATVQADAVIKAGLIRRLKTRLKGYARAITTYDSSGYPVVVRFDENYGSILGSQLSEPLNNTWITKFITELSTAISTETRVTISAIDLTISDAANGKMGFTVRYTINDTNASGELSVETSPGVVNVSGSNS